MHEHSLTMNSYDGIVRIRMNKGCYKGEANSLLLWMLSLFEFLVFRGSEVHNDAEEKKDWFTRLSNSHFSRFHRAPLIKFGLLVVLYGHGLMRWIFSIEPQMLFMRNAFNPSIIIVSILERIDWLPLTWLTSLLAETCCFRYWIDFMLYMMLIGIHTYVTLEKFSNTIQPIEYILLIWFFALLVQEIKQVWCRFDVFLHL